MIAHANQKVVAPIARHFSAEANVEVVSTLRAARALLEVTVHGLLFSRALRDGSGIEIAGAARERYRTAAMALITPVPVRGHRLCNELYLLDAGVLRLPAAAHCLDAFRARSASAAGRVDVCARIDELCTSHGIEGRLRDCLELVVMGYDEKEIAKELGISHNTAKRHLGKLRDVLGLSCLREIGRRVRCGEPLPCELRMVL